MARAAATARFSTGGAHNLWEGGTHNPWEGPVLIGILIPAWNDHWSLRLGSLSILLRHRPCCSIYYLAVRSFKNHHYSWWTNSVSPPSSALERMVNSWDIYLTCFNFVEFQISSSPSSRFSRMLFINFWQHLAHDTPSAGSTLRRCCGQVAQERLGKSLSHWLIQCGKWDESWECHEILEGPYMMSFLWFQALIPKLLSPQYKFILQEFSNHGAEPFRIKRNIITINRDSQRINSDENMLICPHFWYLSLEHSCWP